MFRGKERSGSIALSILSVLLAVSLLHFIQWLCGHSFEVRCVCSMCTGASLTFVIAMPLLVDYIANYQYQLRERERKKTMAERERREALWATNPQSERTIDCEPCKRFDVDDPAMLEFLQKEGYVVIKSALGKEEVENAHSLLWEFLKDACAMRKEEPKTWTNESFCKIGSPINGILSGAGFGQSRLCWFVRQQPVVRNAFAKIWETSDLICSFDGGNIFRPFHHPEFGDDMCKTKGGWFHVDQGPSMRGLQTVQGLVSLCDATQFTGGLCVVPCSHLQHDDLMSYAGFGYTNNFVAVPQADPLVSRSRLVCCQAGDLVLWDSRTVHCNTPATQSPTPENGYPVDRLLRAVTYVCMTPRSKADQATLAKRRNAFVLGVGSSHCPSPFTSISGGIEAEPEAEEAVVLSAMLDRGVQPQNRTLIG